MDLQVAGLGDLPAVVHRLKAIQQQRETLLKLVDQSAPDQTATDIEHAIRQRAAEWRELLVDNPAVAKRGLERVLASRIIVTPRAQRGTFDYRMELTFDGLLEGILTPKAVASPTGFERLRWEITEQIAA